MSRPSHPVSRWARCLLASVALLAAAGADAQEEPEYFPEPPARPHVTLQWDFLARYDDIEHLEYYPAITRGRFELRPEVDLVVSDRFRIGVRGVFDYGTEPNEDDALYGDNYVSRGAYVDRYYLFWSPGSWIVRAGAFAQPVLASEMLWDHDIQTPGAAVTYMRRFGPASTLTITGAGFYSPQRYQDESILGVGQLVWSSGEESRFSIQASAAFWNLDMRNVAYQYYRENRVVLVDGKLQYKSRFQLLDLLVTLRFPVAGLPVAIGLDGIHNFGAVGSGPNAYEGSVTVGSVGTPWTWRAFFTYQYVGREALVGAYNTDDWWYHTWAEGYRAGVALTVLPMVYVQPAVVFQRRLDYDGYLTRVTVDLVKMF
jgi:hypothetical protein